MKPLLIALTFLATFFTQPLFAADREVNPTVLKSFANTFTTAKDVEWTVADNMFKAHFAYNGQVVTAFYTSEGNLLAVSRNITSHQLPIALQTELMKGQTNAWIANLFEITSDEGTAYYATLESAESKSVFKSNGQSWSTFSKTKKN